MAKKKPKLTELIKKAGPKAPKKRNTNISHGTRLRAHKRDKSDSIDIEMIRKWAPHLVACDFDRYRSIDLAFPTVSAKMSHGQKRQFGQKLIKHPMFTDVMAAHLDSIDSKLGNSERYVLDRMYHQAEANVADYFEADADGNLVARNIKSLPRWQQQNIKKLRVTNKVVETGLSRKLIEQTIDIEIMDSFKPVAMLGKNLGMFIERVEVDFGKQTADRLQAALERVREKRINDDGHKQPENEHGSTGAVH